MGTDACETGIGAVLSQIQDGKVRVISYASRTLSKAESNYCVTDKELLAIVYFVGYFKHYLLGREFLVRSDHQTLRWLFTLKEYKGRVARWIETLSSYHFSVEYRPGKKRQNADSMSRCENPRDCKCTTEIGSYLQCGHCKKCKRKSEDMQSTLGTSQPTNTRRIGATKYSIRQGIHFLFIVLLQTLLFIPAQRFMNSMTHLFDSGSSTEFI